MYRDISKTLEALNNINASLANNRICKEQIENLSSGLQSDNINTSESLEQKFAPNLYSTRPSAISVDDASYLKDTLQRDLADLADNNRRVALQAAIDSISTLISSIKHITSTREPELSKLDTIKEYFNRPKKKFDVYDGSLQEDIECEFIPLEIFNNRDQLSIFKSIAKDINNAEARLESIYSESNVQFYAFLNWICKAIKDIDITNSDYNWRLLFENNSISPVNVSLIAEAIIDGRLLDILESLKKSLELELSYAIIDKVDSLKTIHLTSKEVTSQYALDSFKNASIFDKMYKDRVSLSFIEFLYYSIYCKNK